jgi:type I restriction-modification system DNA methylase subunit
MAWKPPTIVHINTLAAHDGQVQERDRYDVILANPPFGSKERPEVQQAFAIKTSETAFLFSRALHPLPENGRPRRHRYQEHLSEQYRQCKP